MKVLSIANVCPNKLGSFENYCVEFSKFLKDNEHEHHVIFDSSPIKEIEDKLVHAGASTSVDKLGRLSIFESLRIIRYLRKNNIDVVHLHFYPILSVFSFLALFLPIKLFATYHISGTPVKASLLKKAYKKIRWMIFGKSYNNIFCVSEFNRRKFLNDFLPNPEQTMVVYNAVNQQTYKELRQEYREGGDPRAGLSIISVAYMIPEKGIQHLIEACAIMKQRIKDFNIRLVGSGPYEEALKAQAEQLDVSSHIQFLGHRNDVPILLARSDIAVIPSVWDEACAYTVVEATSIGLPIIATSVGGNPELVGHDKNGFVISKSSPKELADAIEKLASNGCLRKRFSEASAERAAEMFALPRMFNQQLDAFDEK